MVNDLEPSGTVKKRGRKRTNLSTALSTVATPVFAFDSRRRLVFFNRACEQLTGWTSDDVLLRTAEHRTDGGDSEVDSLVNSLCPPPESLEGRPAHVPVHVRIRDREPVARHIDFEPLTNADGSVSMIIGFVRVLDATPSEPLVRRGVARFHAELAALRASLRRRYGRDGLLALGAVGGRFLEQVDIACRTTSPVLFVGERGTGRTRAAHVVHAAGGATNRILVPLDCEHVSPIELRRTLRQVLGNAGPPGSGLHPGTLLLQNVDALPRELQDLVAEVHTTGTRPTTRLMATTVRDPEVDRRSDVYTDDFYHLLTAQRIDIAPLRERLDDVEPLATAFLEETNRGAEVQMAGFEKEVWSEFRRYHWPGNVAELRAVVEESRRGARGTLIGLSDLPFRFRAGRDARTVGPKPRGSARPLDPLLREVEIEQIQLALDEARDNKSKAADLLGITRARLYRRMEFLGLDGDEPGTD